LNQNRLAMQEHIQTEAWSIRGRLQQLLLFCAFISSYLWIRPSREEAADEAPRKAASVEVSFTLNYCLGLN
jgi:hypothetical protein